MANDSIIGRSDFLRTIENTRVKQLTIGPYWILVDAEQGAGLVATSQNQMSNELTNYYLDKFDKKSLYDLALLVKSRDPIERAIGCATINANTNRYELKVNQENGLHLSTAEEQKIVVVGRFPNLEKKLPTAIVLERNPGPLDLPEEEAVNVIPDCTQLIITASTWVNGSLHNLLKLVEKAHVSLIGPGTPLSPIFKQYGINKLAGFIVHKPQELSEMIENGAGVKQFKHLGMFGTIEL
jgi:hypothetical protein